MNSINIRKGMLQYITFDDVHWDSENDEIKDFSGNENNVELRGGLTTGLDAPNGQAVGGFESDGGDTRIELGFRFVDELMPFSVTVIHKPSEQRALFGGTQYDRMQVDRDNLRVGGSEIFSFEQDTPDNRWAAFTLQATDEDNPDEPYVESWQDGEFNGSAESSLMDTSNAFHTIGWAYYNGWNYQGEVAAFWSHDRMLNESEIKYLHRNAGRMVTQL